MEKTDLIEFSKNGPPQWLIKSYYHFRWIEFRIFLFRFLCPTIVTMQTSYTKWLRFFVTNLFIHTMSYIFMNAPTKKKSSYNIYKKQVIDNCVNTLRKEEKKIDFFSLSQMVFYIFKYGYYSKHHFWFGNFKFWTNQITAFGVEILVRL